MRTVSQILIGLFIVTFLLGGITMVTPFGSEANAGWYKKKRTNHHDLKGNQVMIKESLEVIEANQQMIKDTQAEILKKVMNGERGGGEPGDPLCGAGTGGQRFVPDDVEVCDNTTGLYWVKEPDGFGLPQDSALSACASLDLGNSQTYRLPEVNELLSLVDYSQYDPPLPVGHPFTLSISSSWSATTSVNPAFPGDGWWVSLESGIASTGPTQASGFGFWCVR